MKEAPRPTVAWGDDQVTLLELPQVVHHGDSGRVEVQREMTDRAPRLRPAEGPNAAPRGAARRVGARRHIGQAVPGMRRI